MQCVVLRAENVVSVAGVIVATHSHVFSIEGAVGTCNKYRRAAAEIPNTLAGIIEIKLLLWDVICAIPGS